MQQSFREFQTAINKKAQPKEFKVKGSWGVYDAYKAIRKHGWYDIGRPVTEKEFYAVIREVNKLLAENIANGEVVKFPGRMGFLELRKYKRGVSLVDGKLKNTYPVDWNNTLKLWYEDEEARRNKTLLRDEQQWVFHVKYCKQKANYENKLFYSFVTNTFIKRALSKNIKAGKIDSLWGN